MTGPNAVSRGCGPVTLSTRGGATASPEGFPRLRLGRLGGVSA